MNVAASLSVSLRIREGSKQQRLWGLIICHHNTEKLPSFSLRQQLHLLSQVRVTEKKKLLTFPRSYLFG